MDLHFIELFLNIVSFSWKSYSCFYFLWKFMWSFFGSAKNYKNDLLFSVLKDLILSSFYNRYDGTNIWLILDFFNWLSLFYIGYCWVLDSFEWLKLLYIVFWNVSLKISF